METHFSILILLGYVQFVYFVSAVNLTKHWSVLNTVMCTGRLYHSKVTDYELGNRVRFSSTVEIFVSVTQFSRNLDPLILLPLVVPIVGTFLVGKPTGT